MKLYGYFRSGAAYRVRIALNVKGIGVEHLSRHLRKGEQRDPGYLKINPQGLVPALVLDDGTILTQSLAIMEWLEEKYPNPPLLPKDPVRRAKVRAFALSIAADVHPIQNLRVLDRIKALGQDEIAWARETIEQGLAASEQLIAGEKGPFCFGAEPTMADICLIPQLANARRFKADISGLSRLLEAQAACQNVKAFQDAAPEKQPDAE
ncbi:MAG: maleylacetoacetate isomerase [Hyphomicrobiaceae bacterium]